MHDFTDFYGHEGVVKRVRSLIKHGRFPRSVIIDGAGGSGKTLLAKAIGKTLLCAEGGDSPCGVCVSCVTFDSGTNPDIVFVVPEKSSIKVGEIREQAVAGMNTAPYAHKYKVFIIESADAMTPQAQNALLKTIEEPKSFAVFLLLSRNLNTLLPTVLSRCVPIRLKPLPDDTVKRVLTLRGIDERSATVAAGLSQGSIGRAESMCAGSFFETREHILSLLNGVFAGDGKNPMGLIKAFEFAAALTKYKEEITDVLDILELRYRDILICKERGAAYVRHGDEGIVSGSALYTLGETVRCLEAIRQTRENLGINVNFTMQTEALALALFCC